MQKLITDEIDPFAAAYSGFVVLGGALAKSLVGGRLGVASIPAAAEGLLVEWLVHQQTNLKMPFLHRTHNDVMKYIKFRLQYSVFYFLLPAAIIIPTLFWRKAVIVVIAIIFLCSVLESIFVKCPYCGNRPVRFGMQFPHECRHCKRSYREIMD